MERSTVKGVHFKNSSLRATHTEVLFYKLQLTALLGCVHVKWKVKCGAMVDTVTQSMWHSIRYRSVVIDTRFLPMSVCMGSGDSVGKHCVGLENNC